MIAVLRRLGLARVDRRLPAHHVRAGWPLRTVFSLAVVPILTGCLAGGFVWLWLREHAMLEALLAAQNAVDQRISIVYEQGGIVCKVPAHREKIAPAVHNACQMLARQLNAEAALK